MGSYRKYFTQDNNKNFQHLDANLVEQTMKNEGITRNDVILSEKKNGAVYKTINEKNSLTPTEKEKIINKIIDNESIR